MTDWQKAILAQDRSAEGRAQVDRSVPLNGNTPGKRQRIELGLSILLSLTTPGQTWTCDEIAVFAGCTRSAIWQTEKRALRKLHRKMQTLITEMEGRTR